MAVKCPALFLAAPASGQGKTTITAAIARYFTHKGLDVRVFKTGPDYLDPQILQQASGSAVIQLDLWMSGEAYCRQKLYQAAVVADLILIEGAMGLYDGEPSSVDLAKTFGIPIAIVMDVKGMAQTAAAVFQGLASYRNDFQLAGFIANNCGSERHAGLIRDALNDEALLLATLKRDEAVRLPERHLGLVQSFECTEGIETALEQACQWISDSRLVELPLPVNFAFEAEDKPPLLLNKQRIGIAKDEAFSFIYAANVECLEQMGASIHYFSPLRDHRLPDVDALWLPGGYPELHAKTLSENTTLTKDMQQFHAAGKPILAECGGMLYCADELEDLEGDNHTLLGLIPGTVSFKGRRGCQGMQSSPLPEGTLRGHAHHRSSLTSQLTPFAYGRRQRHTALGEPIYRSLGLTASYLHMFFPSDYTAIAKLLSTRPASLMGA